MIFLVEAERQRRLAAERQRRMGGMAGAALSGAGATRGLAGRGDWPSVDELAAILREINAFDLESPEDEGIEVRLQIVPGDRWRIWDGDPSYDTDHRGYWGASSVPGNSRRFDARAVARDLINEAREQQAQE